MAKRIVTTTEYVDDLTGGKADGTIAFSFGGTDYEIDLSKSNAKAFEKALRPYLDAARRVPTARRRSTSKVAARRQDLGAIREWAAQNGHKIANRGRIPTAIVEEYQAAH